MGWRAFMEIGRQRFGVVCLADAVEAGLTARTVMKRASREGWVRLHPGVYLLPGATDGPMARTAAAVLAADGYAARRSALFLHGVVDQPPLHPHVVVDHRRHGVFGRTVMMHRSRRLPDDHLTDVDGIAATTAGRAIIDLAAGGEHPRRLGALVLDGERRRRLTRDEVAAVRHTLGRGFPGLAAIDRTLEDLGATRSDSGWEHEVRADCLRLGLPVHPEPFPYRCEDGVVVHLDLAFPRHWVYGECDGRAYHSGVEVFGKDRRKWTQLVRHWRPVWITFDRWRYERDAVLADIERVLELADPARAPALPAR
jgi:hypothetical protein